MVNLNDSIKCIQRFLFWLWLKIQSIISILQIIKFVGKNIGNLWVNVIIIIWDLRWNLTCDWMIINAYAFCVDEHLLRVRGRKGGVQRERGNRRRLLDRCATTTIREGSDATPQLSAGSGDGNGDKRITPAERAPPSTQCALLGPLSR